MFRTRVASVVLFLSMVSIGFAGVEPSPFHRQLDALLDEVLVNLEKIADLEIRWPEDARRTLGELTKRLAVFDVETVERKTVLARQVKKSLEVLVLVSGSMLAPKLPVPDAEVASRSVGLMDMISIYGFTPQPDPPGVVLKTLSILDDVSRYAFDSDFNLTEETREQAIGLLDAVSIVGFTPQPEPPGVQSTVISVLDNISALMFTPQPEPPGVDSLTDMKSIIDGMFDLALPEVEVPR